MLKSLIGIFIVMSFLSGCASRTAGWFSKSDKLSLSKKEMRSLRAGALKAWKTRHEKSSLETALASFEK